MRCRLPNTYRRWIQSAALAGGFALTAHLARADRYWINTAITGSWSSTANWNATASTGTGGASIPGSTDNVFILQSDAVARNITLDVTTNILLLRLGNTNASGINTINQTTAVNLTTTGELIGNGTGGHGAHNQSAGTNTYTNLLSIGDGVGSTASYSLSGSGVVTLTGTAAGSGLFLGNDGNGLFNQSAGTVIVGTTATSSSVFMYVGYDGNGVGAGTGAGTYSLSGSGTLTLNGVEYIGFNGSGTFNQTGGSHTVGTAAMNRNLILAQNAGSTGTYNLTGAGALAVQGNEYVGFSGLASFNQSAGSQTISNTLNLANNSSSTGAYSLSGSGVLIVSGNENIGVSGTAAFNQSGGTNTCNGTLVLSSVNTGNCTYSLSASSLFANGGESVGDSGTGTFNQSGGTNTVGTTLLNQTLYIGNNASGRGTFNLSNTGVLTVNGGETIGNAGAGAFAQSGGTHTVNGGLIIGFGSSATGTYSLFGSGVLAVNGIEFISILSGASGAFNQSGGSHTIGTTLSPQSLYLGNNSGATGYYNLSGAGALAVNGTEYIGYSGNGIFAQSGGTHNVGTTASSQTLYLGNNAGATGFYNLSAGALTTFGAEYIGNDGAGIFVQSGGTHTVNSFLLIGYDATSSGSYSLSGSGVLVVKGGEYIGNYATGANAFFQSGGSHTVGTTASPQNLYLAIDASTNGGYDMTGGALTVTGGEIVGSGGIGVFNQSGGTHSIGAGNLLIASVPGCTGIYTLSGTSALTINSSVYVGGASFGAGGTGVLNIQAGAMTVNGTLKIWNSLNSIINFSGGSLTVTSLDTSGIPALFTGDGVNTGWTGGTLTITNSFTIDPTFALGGSVALGAGKVLATSGTATNNGSVALGGGTLSGNVINNTLITGYGTLAGPGALTNNGVITQSTGNLAINAGGGLLNAGTITLAAGMQLQLSNAAAINHGSIALNDGTVTGAITLTNAADGVITGPGTINSSLNFIQQGLLSIPNGLTKTGSFTNAGTIELSGTSANLSGGGTITNAATIEGFGKISNGVINNGTIEAIGGTLSLTAALTNSSTGTLRATSNNKILIQGTGFPANAGLIALAGGTLDTGGQTLTNNGQISGYGVISTGGLTNNAQLQFAPGSSSIYGAVNAGAGSNITVASAASATFNGPLTLNNMSVHVAAGGTAVFFGAVNGNGNLTGTGTIDFEASHSPLAAGILTPATVEVQSTATVDTDALQINNLYLAGNVNIYANGDNAGLSILNSLTPAGGTLNLSNNDLLIHNSTLAAVTPLLKSAYANGAWTGQGITSSTAPANPGQSLAILTGQQYLALHPAALFDGQSIVSTDVLIKYTYAGDATLDGAITIADYAQLDAAFLLHTPNPTWFNGDFNYDGLIDYHDYALIDAAYQLQSGPLAADIIAEHAMEFGQPYLNLLAANTPEPNTLAIMGIAAVGLLKRRRTFWVRR